MCMYAPKDSMRTSEGVITCFKKVWVSWDNGKVRFTAWLHNFSYELGVTYSLHDKPEPDPLNSILFQNSPELEPLNRFLFPELSCIRDQQVILEEGFHSYVSEERANKSLPDGICQVMLKCEIPAGTRYWSGDSGALETVHQEYCSCMIKPVAWKFRSDEDWRTSDVLEDTPENASLIGRMLGPRRKRLY